MVKNIDQFVDDKRRYDEARSKSRISRFLGTCFPCFGRFLGNYIVILYIITKLIFILNTILQVYITSVLLGQDFWIFGLNFISSMAKGQGWTIATSQYFPSNLIKSIK